MKKIRQRSKLICISFTILMVSISVPYQSALAALIDTETAIENNRITETRNYLKKALEREEVKNALTARGIDPLEAQARVDSLSDAEIANIADQIDQLPAGGDSLFIVLILIPLIVFLTIVVLDAMGYTDILPFVKPAK